MKTKLVIFAVAVALVAGCAARHSQQKRIPINPDDAFGMFPAVASAAEALGCSASIYSWSVEVLIDNDTWISFQVTKSPYQFEHVVVVRENDRSTQGRWNAAIAIADRIWEDALALYRSKSAKS